MNLDFKKMLGPVQLELGTDRVRNTTDSLFLLSSCNIIHVQYYYDLGLQLTFICQTYEFGFFFKSMTAQKKFITDSQSPSWHIQIQSNKPQNNN